jgi:hypothetical protein
MTITICGSIKFFDDMVRIQKELEDAGHTVLMPVKADGVDYWAEDNSLRVDAKKGMGLIDKHLEKIDASDAILVVNITKNEIVNYIGANTFLEIGHAHHTNKPIYLLNPIPDQPYIIDEMLTFETIVLDGDVSKLPS